MAPLDDGRLRLFLQEGETKAHMLNHKLENTQALWYSELVAICGYLVVLSCALLLLSLHDHLVVRVQHCELHLNILSVVRMPLALCFLLYSHIELHMVFNFVVLGVWTTLVLPESDSLTNFIAFFIVAQARDFEDAGLLHAPIEKLLAELLIFWIHVYE